MRTKRYYMSKINNRIRCSVFFVAAFYMNWALQADVERPYKINASVSHLRGYVLYDE